MRHLTEAEIVDLVDGALALDRQRHADSCDACRAAVASVREAVARVSDAEVPEPSPLFWDHFSARVRDAVRETTHEEPRRWFSGTRRATLPWAAAGTVATAVLVVAVWVAVWRASAPDAPRPETPAAQPAIAADASGTDIEAFDPDTDEAWALVRTVADDVAWDGDEAPGGITVRPGSAERALANLTRAERTELARLLEAETRM
jgi:hypothetical protein